MSWCTNDGCFFQQSAGDINQHREQCGYQRITCPDPACGARILRMEKTQHVTDQHMHPSVEQLECMWEEIAESREVHDELESEKRHHAMAPIAKEDRAPTWVVFNWRADGWEPGVFASVEHAFDVGVERVNGVDGCVQLGMGYCLLEGARHDSPYSHFFGFMMDTGKVYVHAKFMVLDMFDKTLSEVFELGTAAAPLLCDFAGGLPVGCGFSPTVVEKGKALRGVYFGEESIRLRAVVCATFEP